MPGPHRSIGIGVSGHGREHTIVPITKSAAAPAIAFGRDQWQAITGLPLTTCNELVALGLIRSMKVGKRRIFLHADVTAMLEKLARTGKTLEPRKLYLARRAKGARP